MTPPATPTDPALPIYTLLRNSDVGMALGCLPTLFRHGRDPFRLTVLDDGSLTPEDGDRLRDGLGPVAVVSRAEADDLVLPALRDKPNCRKYRREHAFALKLIDPPLLAGGAFALCDGDVLFLRPFAKFDRRGEAGEDLVFMKDWTTAYSMGFTKRHWGPSRLRMPEFVNAGILYAGPRAADLDFIEWFLGQAAYRKHMWVMEQTAWAALGGRVHSHYFDPAQVAFPRKDSASGDDWVALHFIAPVRYRLGDRDYLAELSRQAAAYQESVTTLRTRPAVYVDVLRDVVGRVSRRLSPRF